MPSRPLISAAALILALWPALPAAAGAQLTREVTPAVAAARADLDRLLRPGRIDQGTRASEQQLRAAFSNRVRTPFIALLLDAERIQLSNDQMDSIAIINRNFARTSDSAWSPAVRYLAALPAEYDIGPAWDRVSAAYTVVVARLETYARMASAVLTEEQHALLRPEVRRLLDTTCIRGFHPTAHGGGIGGAGASGIGVARAPGC